MDVIVIFHFVLFFALLPPKIKFLKKIKKKTPGAPPKKYQIYPKNINFTVDCFMDEDIKIHKIFFIIGIHSMQG